jgi:hypothetical protein
MTSHIRTAAAALFGAALLAGPAAANLTINGGTPGLIPSGTSGSNIDNDFLEQQGANFFSPGELGVTLDGRVTLGGFFGAFLSGTAPRYRFDFFGSEASFDNQLWFTDMSNPDFSGTPAISTGGGTGGGNGDFPSSPMSPVASFESSTLDFVIRSVNNGSEVDVVENAAFDNSGFGNPDDIADGALTPNFFLTFGNNSDTQGNVAWLFLDDGGANENDNHDDMVVRISAVPLPPGVLLLGLGLSGLAAYRRRKAA